MAQLLEKLRSGPLLADGAMGTMLHARGIPLGHCFDELNLSQPAVVVAVHRAYVDAGAEIILTNSFGANRHKLSGPGLAHRAAEINAAAATLAREAAAAAASRQILVAGDVGPLGVRLAPFGRVKPAYAYDAFREQIEALLHAGVDLIAVETMTDLREAAQAVRAARDLGAVPVIATMTFTRDDCTLLGENPGRVAAELARLGADFIGVNCSSGPAQAMRILEAMRRVLPAAHYVVKPNAGWPEQVGGRVIYAATPEYFGSYAVAFAEAGAAIIGGCCGTTPAHIAAMRAALDAAPEERRSRRLVTTPPKAPALATPTEGPTRLAQALASGKFVVSVEMDPPRGFSTHKLLAGAHLLAEAGADVINVADSPMARMRMSPWAVCHLIQREVQIETVLHFPTRGRSLLRVQGDLLAAHTLGIRNLFVVLGDPTAIGDYPNALDDYDLLPSGLIRLIKQGLNLGVDHAGAEIGQPTSFLVGCAVNLCAPNPDKEIRALHKKIAAGADFALTQPVYEVGPARELIRRYQELFGPLRLPLLVGVLPLYNARHAAFLHNEVPGITIPEAMRDRMAAADNAGAEEGIRIALALLAELMGVVQGAYLMPPFGRYDLAAEIIDRVREEAA
jgi:methionine synthase / methylenetetrahydrofolate reductase (NADH)